MKLGYSINSSQPLERNTREAVSEIMELSQVAADSGYAYVEAGDYHLADDRQYFQTIPMLSRLSDLFDHVAPLYLLPLFNPIMVAEDVGTLSALTVSCDFWCAIGGHEKHFEAFDIPISERVPRLIEQIALIRHLWTEDDVTYRGEFEGFYDVDDATINPKPDPTPRVCIGGAAKPAVRRAGRIGDAWVAQSSYENIADIERKLEWFQEGGGGDLIVRRDALVLEDGDEAKEIVESKLANGYRGWPSDADWMLYGGADDVAHELGRLKDIGADEVVVRAMDSDYASETLREVAHGFERV